MNNILLICGMVLLGGTPAQMEKANLNNNDIGELNLDDVVYIEEEQEIELGFDTADYLPEGFDPCEVYFDLSSVEYIEAGQDFELGFDTGSYLPKGFDPYADPSGISGINYMEEEEIELDFDTADYLPENFDSYHRVAKKNETLVF